MANFKRACLQAVKKKEGKLCLHEKMRYFSPKKLALLLSITLTLPVFDAVAAPADYPFPVYPIISQPYINRTTPMIFAFVDNSTTMNTTAKMKDKNNKSIAKSKADFGWPDRIDVVKRGLHGMVDKYYDEFDWGLVVIADQRRQLNWWPYSDSNLGLDGSKPIWESGHAGYDANYGWLQNFPAERRGNLIKWIGDNGSRLPDSSGSWTYHQDSKGKFFGKPMLFAPKSHNDTNKAELLGQIRSINTTLDASFMEDTYPQLLNVDQRRHHTGKKNSYRDMQSIPDFVKFRCQDLFVIVFTDGNRVGDEDNYGPAHWAAENPPKSSNEYDQDTKPQKYNGPDFPNQRIYTSAVGLDTHTDARAKKFETFVNRAGGTFFLSEDADELGEWFEEYVENKRPKYFFSASAPAATHVMDGTGKQFAVSLQVEINRWLSSVKMTHLDNKNNVVLNGISPKYDYQNHVVIGSSAKSNIWVNLTTASESILANNFDNSSFGITKNSDDYAKNYIPWLATSIQDDRTTQYRNRVVKIDGVPGATNTPSNEYRYLGDTLNTNVFMVGQTNATLGVPGYMVFGSNDGMLKIYQSGAGNDKMKPYSYSLGAIPGMIPRDDYGTLYQAMYKRSTPGYAIRDENPHMFGVNGGLATRHTNRDHLFAVATTGQGGRGVFAVSIAGTKEGSTEVGSTPKKVGLSETKEKWGDSVPLWESSRLTNLNDNLGYTVGNPIIGVIAKYRDNSGKPKFDNVYQAAVVSNGYDGPKKENAALFVDALGVNIGESGIDQSAGSLIGKTSVTSSLSKHYGLSAPALVDLNLDGIADIAYAGDRNGDLYRIDLRKTDPTQWKLVKIYSGSPDKPITSAPAFSRFKKKQVVTFATGSSLYGTDLLFEKQQTIYGIFDTPDVADDVFTAITENDLVEQTFTTPELVGYIDANVNNKRSLRMLSNNPIGAAHRGWKIDLSISQDSGGKYNGHEQATTSINVVEGAVLLSTTWVRPDAFADLNSGTQVMCFRDLTNRTGSIMMINVLTGGSLTVKDTHMSATVNATISGGKVAGGSKVAISGYLTNDLTSPLLVYSNKMYTINKEGQFTLYNNAPNPVIAEGGVKTNYQLFPELGYCKDELCRQNVEEELKHCVDGKTGDAAEVISIGFTEGGEMKGGTITPCISSIDPIVKRLSWRIIS